MEVGRRGIEFDIFFFSDEHWAYGRGELTIDNFPNEVSARTRTRTHSSSRLRVLSHPHSLWPTRPVFVPLHITSEYCGAPGGVSVCFFSPSGQSVRAQPRASTLTAPRRILPVTKLPAREARRRITSNDTSLLPPYDPDLPRIHPSLPSLTSTHGLSKSKTAVQSTCSHGDRHRGVEGEGPRHRGRAAALVPDQAKFPAACKEG